MHTQLVLLQRYNAPPGALQAALPVNRCAFLYSRSVRFNEWAEHVVVWRRSERLGRIAFIRSCESCALLPPVIIDRTAVLP